MKHFRSPMKNKLYKQKYMRQYANIIGFWSNCIVSDIEIILFQTNNNRFELTLFELKKNWIMMKRIGAGLVMMLVICGFAEAQMPTLNQNIVDYAASQIGKKVDRGECWDLAYKALTINNCEWDGKYVYGKKLNPKTDSIYPGDLIQFEGVVVKYTKGDMIVKESYPHHTAIVYEVLGRNHYKIAHQNFEPQGKKVGISELDLTHKTAGKVMFYRPVAKK